MQQKPQTKTPRSAAGEKLWPPPVGRDGAAAYRQTTEKLRLLESAVQQATDAIVIITAELGRPGPRIVYVNSAFTTLTGYTAAEVVGRTPRILQGAKTERKELERVRRTLQAGRPCAGEITNYRKDGTPYVVEWHLTPVRGEKGEITHWVAIQRDITERSRTQAALTGLVAELQRSHTDLQQFAYAASHDLQEPLRMVRSYVQLLAKHYQGKLDAAADEFIGYTVEGVCRMEQLVRGLRDYCQVGTRRPTVAVIDCETLLEQTLANLQVAVAEGGAVVTHDPLPVVRADHAQLGQVLQHLIGNALKFHGAEPAHVHVTARHEGRQWVFAIHDNGIGLDPRQATRIFQLFQRLHTREQYPGTGMGLALCQKIVERHGGRIWVESTPGQGATFFFTLPAP